ncbi:iron uptake porin [Lyngbya confervoides]|uniref:Iron uptake porin n=1 Tax=Lyngbya confervoides BDU141951 TaxID=1574623 RepID=A0ABD4T8X3_9CYAN|nr:iron uptake porin [Lyngbya confervoides]MCM1984945.1 iron uptake porin [Lyngbya confervoides BDU141951]
MKRIASPRFSLLTSAVALVPAVAIALPSQAIDQDPISVVSPEAVEKVGVSPKIPPAPLADISLTRLTSNVQDLLSETESMGVVNSVSQLSDVQPTDWAYQALQSLVERYGCLAGYPEGTFRGNRAATRYEMAALVNACLDNLSDQVATPAELDQLRALQEEFKAELSTLRGQVDGLEARTAQLEANEFSTTTKLNGLAVFQTQFGDLTRDGLINPETGAAVPTGTTRPSVIAVSILNFDTSFTGTDLLQTALAAGNNGQDAATGLGMTLYPNASGNAGQPYFVTRGTSALTQYPNSFYLFRLAYTFQPTDNLSLTVGPQLYPGDFLDFNSYANNPFSDFNSYFFTNNPLIIPFSQNFLGGAGGGLNWNIEGGPVSLRAAYVAANPATATATTNGGGLFGDPYQASAEVEYADTFGESEKNNFAVRLQYTHSKTFDVEQNAVGVNAEMTLGQLGLFGRYGYSDASADGTATAPGGPINFTAHTWMAGAGVTDLVKPGSLLAVAVGQPFIHDLPATASFGPNNATQTNYEGFFRLPINDNISITPGLMVITETNNTANQPSLFQGYIRTTFSF